MLPEQASQPSRSPDRQPALSLLFSTPSLPCASPFSLSFGNPSNAFGTPNTLLLLHIMRGISTELRHSGRLPNQLPLEAEGLPQSCPLLAPASGLPSLQEPGYSFQVWVLALELDFPSSQIQRAFS